MSAAPKKRSVAIAGHRTSLTLEDPFWQDLARIAERRGQSVSALVAGIDRGERQGSLSSALRLFVRQCYVAGELP